MERVSPAYRRFARWAIVTLAAVLGVLLALPPLLTPEGMTTPVPWRIAARTYLGAFLLMYATAVLVRADPAGQETTRGQR